MKQIQPSMCCVLMYSVAMDRRLSELFTAQGSRSKDGPIEGRTSTFQGPSKTQTTTGGGRRAAGVS